MFDYGQPQIADLLKHLPEELPVLPLRNMVAFPFSVLPIVVGTPRSLRLTRDAMEGSRLVMLVTTRDPETENPAPHEVHWIGAIGLIQRAVNTGNGAVQLMVQTLERARIAEWKSDEPYLTARVTLTPDIEEDDTEADALNRSLIDLSRELVALMPNVPPEIVDALEQIESNRLLAYTIAANARLENEQRLEILERDSVNAKMSKLLEYLAQEREMLEIGQRIRTKAQEQVSKEQREFMLRRQMDSIRQELGESEDEAAELDNYRKKIENAGMTAEAAKQALTELKRMEKLSPQAAEYGVIRTYLDWLVDLPWSKITPDNLDINNARQVLDADHYGLQDVKARILEFLAVRKLAAERGGSLRTGAVIRRRRCWKCLIPRRTGRSAITISMSIST
jgi:ATP-dependent Lon protease